VNKQPILKGFMTMLPFLIAAASSGLTVYGSANQGAATAAAEVTGDKDVTAGASGVPATAVGIGGIATACLVFLRNQLTAAASVPDAPEGVDPVTHLAALTVQKAVEGGRHQLAGQFIAALKAEEPPVKVTT
jgi:hypothetical protein